MNQIVRRFILAFTLIAGLAPAFAQAPPPVPALPDTERRTTYSISGSSCACAVGFQLYGDGSDFWNWLEVYLNGTRVNFDDPTFDRSAASFENPDHVAIVIHNYRWRLGLAEGEVKYDGLEKRLADAPVITVPTITMEGDANGAPHPNPSSYAKKFSGKYLHRTIKGGIGHNLPQEAPQEFAKAVIEVDGY